MKKIYISGKITGIEKDAPVIFERAEKYLRQTGYEPVNPLKINHSHDLSWRSYMVADIKALCDCDGIYMLTNYHESRGARIELKLANYLEMEVMFEHRRIFEYPETLGNPVKSPCLHDWGELHNGVAKCKVCGRYSA